MRLYELETAWVATEAERRYLHWELLACDELVGVFDTARDDVLAVLFDGESWEFHKWASALAPQAAA